MGIPILHQTDLFHPHEDPDDHWDLACVFALAYNGGFDLRGVLIDHPPAGHAGTPDAMGIAQLNRISGLAVPFAVGSSVAVRTRGEGPDRLPVTERNGVQFVLRTLESAPEPVVLTIVGSCRDVALAGAAAPELFRAKCRAVYLNAGSGTRQPELLGELEYNVRLNAAAFGGIFDLPCPVLLDAVFRIHAPAVVRGGTRHVVSVHAGGDLAAPQSAAAGLLRLHAQPVSEHGLARCAGAAA